MPPKRSLTRKRQSKLTFSPLPSSSPGATALSPQVRSRAATASVNSSPSSRPAKRRKVIQLSDSDTEAGLPTPKKSFQSNIGTPSKREVDRGMALGMPASTQKRGMFGSSDNEVDLSSSTSASEAQKPSRPTRKTTRRNTAQKPPPPPRPESDSNDSDAMPDTTPPRRARRAVNGHSYQRQRQRSDSFEVPDDQVVEDSEDSVVPRSTQRRRAPRQATESEEEEENFDEDNTSSRRAYRKHSRQEEEDLEEDLNFLQSSPPPDQGRLRSTQEKPLNERQKALAALKRKRAKASSSIEPSSSATPGRRRAIILDDSESDLEVIEEEKASEIDDLPEQDDGIDDDEESDDSQTSRGNRIKALDVFYENADDADFLDDDDDGPIGEPAEDASIPLQFTALSRAKPRELFKFAIDWMVQKKINPAFASDNEIYELTFRKLNDEVAALANSKYSSSVWRPDFIRALRARPDIEISEIGRLERSIGEAHCEACNRKTHPASFSIAFVGKPYHRDTLEPLAEDTDSESGSSSDSDSDSDISSTGSSKDNNEKPTYDAQGEIIPPDSHVFTVGSHCKANAQMAHTLHHWRHHLYSWVVDYLIREGHCTPEKLVERDRWSQRKREKYAKRIVKKMDKIGEIRKLHHLYKEQVEFALEARNEYKSGWGRS